jgi:hypothetical protein
VIGSRPASILSVRLFRSPQQLPTLTQGKYSAAAVPIRLDSPLLPHQPLRRCFQPHSTATYVRGSYR